MRLKTHIYYILLPFTEKFNIILHNFHYNIWLCSISIDFIAFLNAMCVKKICYTFLYLKKIGGIIVLLNEALKQRLDKLMEEKQKSSKYQVSCDAGINPSILNDFYRNRISYPRIDTLFLICEGLGITLEEFFKDSIFNIENIEVKDSEND